MWRTCKEELWATASERRYALPVEMENNNKHPTIAFPNLVLVFGRRHWVFSVVLYPHSQSRGMRDSSRALTVDFTCVGGTDYNM